MKKKPTTPRSRVKAALHKLWLRSRERAAALKRDGYCCCRCGVKQSKAKGKEVSVQVHHLHGVRWEELIDDVYTELIQHPDNYQTMCKECHRKEHDGQ